MDYIEKKGRALKPATVDQTKQCLRQEWRRLEADGELTQFIYSLPEDAERLSE